VIRINSQSGKGGISYLLETEYGIAMPRRLQVEFSGLVQRHTEESGGEMEAADIWAVFSQTYLAHERPIRYVRHQLFEKGAQQGIRLIVEKDGEPHTLTGAGNGPIDAAVHALSVLGITVQVRSYEEKAMGTGEDAKACAFMEVMLSDGDRECYGVGMDTNIVTASIRALLSGVDRLLENRQESSEAQPVSLVG
jgi:2-isopropylmalate synthase